MKLLVIDHQDADHSLNFSNDFSRTLLFMNHVQNLVINPKFMKQCAIHVYMSVTVSIVRIVIKKL